MVFSVVILGCLCRVIGGVLVCLSIARCMGLGFPVCGVWIDVWQLFVFWLFPSLS